MSSIGNERQTVQNPFIRYAARMGRTYLPPEEAQRLRCGETGLLLHEVFVAQMQRLNPEVVDLQRAEDMARRLATVSPTIEGNLRVWEYLQGLRTVFVPSPPSFSGKGAGGLGRERNVCLLDTARIERNSVHVMGEFSFSNGVKPKRPDIIFLINGIPVLDVEAKAATHENGLAEALLGEPISFRDEVIVHELLHLKLPNHARLFRALLRAFLTEEQSSALTAGGHDDRSDAHR